MPLNMFRPKASQPFATLPTPPPHTHTGGAEAGEKAESQRRGMAPIDGACSCACRWPVFNGLTRPECTGKGEGGGGLLEGKEVRWGHPGPRRTANTCALLRAVEGLPLSSPTDFSEKPVRLAEGGVGPWPIGGS